MSQFINGGILKRKQRIHACPCPGIDEHKIETDDTWTCGLCGSIWTCKYQSDCRPGEGGPYWERTQHRTTAHSSPVVTGDKS